MAQITKSKIDKPNVTCKRYWVPKCVASNPKP